MIEMQQRAAQQDWRTVDLSCVDWDEIWTMVAEVEPNFDPVTGTILEDVDSEFENGVCRL